MLLKVDFLNIDVEGSDLDVLQSFDVKKYQPALICIELYPDEKLKKNNQDIIEYLSSNNYSLIKTEKTSAFFKCIKS